MLHFVFNLSSRFSLPRNALRLMTGIWAEWWMGTGCRAVRQHPTRRRRARFCFAGDPPRSFTFAACFPGTLHDRCHDTHMAASKSASITGTCVEIETAAARARRKRLVVVNVVVLVFAARQGSGNKHSYNRGGSECWPYISALGRFNGRRRCAQRG